MISLLLFMCSCHSDPPESPFVLDQDEVGNIEAFKEASKYIINNWVEFSQGHYRFDEMQGYLETKNLQLKKFNEFYLSTGNDTTISFTNNNKYVVVGDTVFRHSVIYSNKPRKEVMPTNENRMLIKRIDTNLYYMILIDRCPGC